MVYFLKGPPYPLALPDRFQTIPAQSADGPGCPAVEEIGPAISRYYGSRY